MTAEAAPDSNFQFFSTVANPYVPPVVLQKALDVDCSQMHIFFTCPRVTWPDLIIEDDEGELSVNMHNGGEVYRLLSCEARLDAVDPKTKAIQAFLLPSGLTHKLFLDPPHELPEESQFLLSGVSFLDGGSAPYYLALSDFRVVGLVGLVARCVCIVVNGVGSRLERNMLAPFASDARLENRIAWLNETYIVFGDRHAHFLRLQPVPQVLSSGSLSPEELLLDNLTVKEVEDKTGTYLQLNSSSSKPMAVLLYNLLLGKNLGRELREEWLTPVPR